MNAEADGLKIRKAGLRMGAIRCNIASHASPHIRFIRHIRMQDEIVRGVSSTGRRRGNKRAVPRVTFPGRRTTYGYGRIQIRAIVSEQSASMIKLRLGCFNALVRDIDFFFQSTEFWVLIKFPPLAAQHLVRGLGRFPVGRSFLKVWRRRRGRARIARTYCAATGQKTKDQAVSKQSPLFVVPRAGHYRPDLPGTTGRFPPSGSPAGGLTMRTSCPETSESGGFTITDSSPDNPATTSISVP